MGDMRKREFAPEFYQTVLEKLQTDVCITDSATDEIVYMNESMRQEFCVSDPCGRKCWEVLAKGMCGRCRSCRLNELSVESGKKVCIWDEKSQVTGRVHKNYANLLEWEGAEYNVRNSTDITEYTEISEIAKIDELTGTLNRRAGKARLNGTLLQAREEQKILTVAMLDVNELKKVNDQYGHKEGDNLLRFMATVLMNHLSQGDYIFRLSGDEFIIVFYDKDLREVNDQMHSMQELLEKKRREFSIYYDVSFSYGAQEFYPGDSYTVSDVIGRTDEQMYIQKRNFHILKAKEQLNRKRTKDGALVEFNYDKEHLFEALTAGTDDYLFVGNMKTGIFQYSPDMVDEFGLPGQVVENAAAFWSSLIHPNDEKLFLESNQEIADGRASCHDIEYRAKNAEGEWVWLRCRGKMIQDERGIPDTFAGMITNLGKKNMIDHMTGLYNRFEFEGKVKKYLVDEGQTRHLGIMILNMDGFKNINDLYNHSFGDGVLRFTAQKIASLLNENAQVFRLDGDEFGIILLNGDENESISMFSRIQHTFSRQQEYNGKRYYCTISAGYVSYPGDADNYLDLLKYANYSLEHAKSSGKNRMSKFSPEILQEKERKLELTEMLRESIERGYAGFSVCYQPQVDSVTKELYGSEALARWHCTKYGDISPAEFIPILEQSGMIVQLGSWIFYHAAAQCREWRKLKPDFHMSVNLSYIQLLEGDIVSYIRQTLEEMGLPPANITLELTETYLIKEDTAVDEVLNRLHGMGIQVAMDDFGVGYSSLYSLKNTPVDLVKIDRGFVKGIMADKFTITFIKAITELCHNADKKVCLEGVETAEEYDTVKGIGLELIQGFYFGHPINAKMFEKKFF